MAIFPAAIASDTDLFLVSNNLGTALISAIDDLVTTIPVVSTTGFPSTGYITIDQEAITYTSINATNFLGATRGAGGTVAASHVDASQVKQTAVAAHHNSLKDEIKALEQNIVDRFGLNTNLVVPSGISFTINSTGGLVITPTTNQLVLGSTRTVTINAPTPATSSRVWTLPDLATSPTFMALEGTQAVTGVKTFDSGALKLQEAGGSDAATILVAALGAARNYTVPDAGAAASFVMTEGAQTINGSKTLSALLGTLAANLAAAGFKITGLGAGSTAGDSVRFEQLKVIQVVSATSESTFTTTSSTFQTTNCSASITPSSTSNKVLILAMGHAQNNAWATTDMHAALFRDSTILTSGVGVSQQRVSSGTAGNTVRVPCAFAYLDSPSSTSSLTYSVKIRSSDNTTTVGFNGSSGQTSIILIEVAP